MSVVGKLDDNHDWEYGKFLSNEEALKQNIKTRVLSFYNDCFFDKSAGIDYDRLLDLKNTVELEASIKKVIKTTENVTDILFYESNVSDDRALRINVKVESIYGILNIEFIV